MNPTAWIVWVPIVIERFVGWVEAQNPTAINVDGEDGWVSLRSTQPTDG